MEGTNKRKLIEDVTMEEAAQFFANKKHKTDGGLSTHPVPNAQQSKEEEERLSAELIQQLLAQDQIEAEIREREQRESERLARELQNDQSNYNIVIEDQSGTPNTDGQSNDSTTNNNNSQQTATCPICFDDFLTPLTYALTSCHHRYCIDCLQTYFTSKVEAKELPIKCPLPDCKTEVLVRDVESVVDKECFDRFQRFTVDTVVETNPDIYSCCPTPDCGYYFVWYEGDDPHFRCEKCSKHYCLSCKTEYHKRMTCLEFKKAMREIGKADELFNAFVTGKKFKQCPSCKRWVEKGGGCNHIYCRCGHEFCYSCGKTSPCQCGRDPHHPVGPHMMLLQDNEQEPEDDEEDDEGNED